MEARYLIFLLALIVGCSAKSGHTEGGNVDSSFNEFLIRVESAEPDERPGIVDSFFTEVSIPNVVADTAVFMHRGDYESVAVAGDMNGWNPAAAPMQRLEDTDFWFSKMVLEPNARIDYKLVLDDSAWILDPHNPNQIAGGFGSNSEIAMSDYEQPTEIQYREDVAHGVVVDTTFIRPQSAEQQALKMYLPPGYNSANSYGFILFHDGDDFLNLASAANVLDNLIADDRIDPVVAAFITSADRDAEYGFSRTDEYERFVVDDLMPWIMGSFAVTDDPGSIATTGVSLGGLISTQLCFRNPQTFGLCAPMSPSYWVEDRALMDEVLSGDVQDVSIYIDWGTYEPSIAETGRTMRDSLIAKGYEVQWNEWYEGHSWGNWRAHLDDMLVSLFGNDPVRTGD